MSEPLTFRFELGFNQNAVMIGSPEHPDLDPPIFPLQINLVAFGPESSPPEPFWCTRFNVGDELSFRLVDITDLVNPGSSQNNPKSVKLVFKGPDGKKAQPFTENVHAEKWTFGTEVMCWSPAYSRSSSQKLPTWDIRVTTESDGDQTELVFAPIENDFQRYELSGWTDIQLSDGRDASYVFDPEIIVSDGGQAPIPIAPQPSSRAIRR